LPEVSAGWISEHVGYPFFFTVAAIVSVLAIAAMGLLMRGMNDNAVVLAQLSDDR
jgi:hypothetical protein